MKKVVIGLAGPIASGKGTISKLLQEHGFVHTSLSDRIREECRKRGIPIEKKRCRMWAMS